MRQRTFSEQLFEEFCESNGIPCMAVPVGSHRTRDYEITVSESRITCEVKQIDPNREDLAELPSLDGSEAEGRLIPNRLRDRLKRVSKQLRAAADTGQPTLLVVYDNTPFKSYTMHSDVVQAMFGHHSVKVWFSHDSDSRPRVSRPFFGANRGVGPAHNTAVSAIGVLESGPTVRPLTIRLYHNPYARVRLEPGLLTALPVSHAVLPDAKSVTL